MECPIVNACCGPVQGFMSKASHPDAKPVCNFLAIPYGKPPVGALRFMPPVKVDKWTELFKATKTYPLCPQDTSVAALYDTYVPFKNPFNHSLDLVSEDCLQVNLFTPQCSPKEKLPVMVWMTGGHYQRHYGGRADGSALAGMNDVVVVAPNHRVNAFGFLSLGRGSSCPGNNAIRDVILALQWVQENISAFGGDPQNVTIFGESSGAGVVHTLMMSPLSKGLFHKAILLSGALLSPPYFAPDLSIARDVFFKTLGMEWNPDEEKKILEKLQAMPAEKIMEGQKLFKDVLYFLPTIDGEVMTHSPKHILETGQAQRVPLLIGFTNTEGGTLLSFRSFSNFLTGISEEQFKEMFFNILKMSNPNSDGPTAFEALMQFYDMKSRSDDPLRFSWLHSESLGDGMVIVPSLISATAHAAAGNPTYLFKMTQTPDFSHSETNGPGVAKKAPFCECDHADDLFFVWGEPFNPGELSGGATFTDEEAELSINVMRYLANFAKTGNPNKPSKVELEWPPYSAQGDRTNMVLQTPLKTEVNFGLDKVAFYTKLSAPR